MAVHDAQFEIDTVCSLLKSALRRQTLRSLDGEGTLTLEELTQILEEDNEESDSVGPLKLRLYHEHLPKLAESGVIEHDTKTNVVSITTAGTQLLSALDELEQCEGDDGYR